MNILNLITPKNNNKQKKKVREKRGGHMIKCLLTELDWAGRENIWPSVMAHGPRWARSVHHDLKYFPDRPSLSVNKYIFCYYGYSHNWLLVGQLQCQMTVISSNDSFI